MPGLVDSARPHQRARPHRVGGVRHRHARGRGRRRDDARRHAAQQHPATTTTVDGLAQKRAAARRASAGSTWASGAASCPATRASCAASSRAGVLGFKCFLVDSGVHEFPACTRPSCARRCAVLATLGVRAPRATPSCPDRIEARTPHARARSAPRTRPTCARGRAAAEDEAIELLVRALPRDGRRASTSFTSRRPSALAAPAPRRATRGSPLTAETCPHYLHVRRRGDPRRRDGLQVRAADPRAREPREAVGRAARRASIDMVVSDHSPCTARAEALEAGDFVDGLGRHRVARSSGCRRSGPRRAGAGIRPRRARATGCAPRPRELAGLDGRKGAHRRRDATPTSSSGIPTPSFTVDAGEARAPPQAHARTPAATLARRRCAPRTCAGETIYDGEPVERVRAGELLCERTDGRMSDVRASCVDLAAERLGGAVLSANDEFFAPQGKPAQADGGRLPRGRVHRARQVDGRLGDAPPARRRATTGASCASGCPGVVRGVVVDTAFFTRQLPGAVLDRGLRRAATTAPRTPAPDAALGRGAAASRRSTATPTNRFADRRPAPRDARAPQHLSRRRRRAPPRPRRGRCPTGGALGAPAGDVDLAAVENGGARRRAAATCSSASRHNLIMPGRAREHGRRLGDEAAPRARPRLGRSCGSAGRARSDRIEVDTNHFKGNAPRACSVDVCRLSEADGEPGRELAIGASGAQLLPRTKLAPHARHSSSASSMPRAGRSPTSGSTSIRTAA